MAASDDILQMPLEGECSFPLTCITSSRGKLVPHYVGLWVLWLAALTQSLACWDKIGPSSWLTTLEATRGPHGQAGMRSVPGASYLLHVVACLRTGFDEHDTQFFGALFPLLDGYLPGDETRGKISSAEKQPLVDMVGVG